PDIDQQLRRQPGDGRLLRRAQRLAAAAAKKGALAARPTLAAHRTANPIVLTGSASARAESETCERLSAAECRLQAALTRFLQRQAATASRSALVRSVFSQEKAPS